VAVSALASSLAWSVRSTFALFYVALLEEFGWARGDAALGYALSWLLLVAFSPLAGWLHDRLGARVVVPAGGLVLGLGMALTGLARARWHYDLSFGVLGAAGIALIMMPAAAVTSRWFEESRGAALGIVSAGASASAVVFYPLNAWLIATLGWRLALAAYGGIIVALVVPAALVGYRRPPPAPPAPAAAAAGPEWTPGEALRTRGLWAAVAMWGLGVIGYQIMTTHQVAHAVDRGFDATTAAWIFGLGGLATTAGNVAGGALSDRWGRAVVFALGSAIGVGGIAALAGLGGPDDLLRLGVYAAAGFGFGMRISLLSAIPADLFRGPHFGAILGVVNAGGGLGGFVGPYLGGLLFDWTGSYRVAFAVAAAAIAGSAVAAWIALPPGRRPPRPPRRGASGDALRGAAGAAARPPAA
jgi:MFS family permease